MEHFSHHPGHIVCVFHAWLIWESKTIGEVTMWNSQFSLHGPVLTLHSHVFFMVLDSRHLLSRREHILMFTNCYTLCAKTGLKQVHSEWINWAQTLGRFTWSSAMPRPRHNMSPKRRARAIVPGTDARNPNIIQCDYISFVFDLFESMTSLFDLKQ